MLQLSGDGVRTELHQESSPGDQQSARLMVVRRQHPKHRRHGAGWKGESEAVLQPWRVDSWRRDCGLLALLWVRGVKSLGPCRLASLSGINRGGLIGWDSHMEHTKDRFNRTCFENYVKKKQ